jgi:glycyl-tRNA synthetase beta chain
MGGFPDIEKSKRAADLCKADLVTDMVREFPELQGIMSRIYAGLDGEDPAVSAACEEHYWPITLTGPLPSSPAASLVALADKLDTLAGDFAVGLIPTGSADPYGLRRAAVGILRILEASKDWPLDPAWLIEKALDVQPDPAKNGAGQARLQLNLFMRQRLTGMLAEHFKADEIEAVIDSGIGVVPVTIGKIKVLHELRKLPEFDKLANLFKRTSNIIRQAREKNILVDNGDSPQAEFLREECERQLWNAYSTVEGRIKQTEGFEKILRELIPLNEPLAGFFDGVMVMVDDEALRTNRLRLLYKINQLFHPFGDFSKLQNA